MTSPADNSDDAAGDRPGIIAMPPLIALATLALGLVVDRLIPIGVVGALLPRSVRFALAAILFLLACWVVYRAVSTFVQVGTNVDARKPALSLATSGIYRNTRNPMYQGLGLLLLSFTALLASDWTLLLLMPWALIMHVGVVLREERYLERKFGDEYRLFKQRVPRYGWPF
jgi:protein-S-isoprenylcysteine O-methyltransferase Ste14